MADDFITEDLPDPEAVAVDAARTLTADLVERATADVSVAFTDDVLAAVVLLRNRSLVDYISLEQRLHGLANFPKGQFREAVRAAGKTAFTRAEQERKAAASWASKLTYTNGKPDPTEANCVTALVHSPDWKGVLAFNEFANNVVTRKPPPWFKDDVPAGGPRMGPWDDDDDVRLVCWFQRAVGLRVSPPTALNALVLVARRTTFHPVREYLDGLAWDGVQRLPTWLERYARAKQPREYLERVGTWFMISAVARVYDPGCKADHCIILEGKQGRGKSTLVQRLVPQPEWFAEHNANLLDKDSYAILQGRWILELAELDSIAKAEVGRTKRYMTTAVDAYRPVWARRVARFPRHCVFIGTVNDSEYLRDPTGNRRFWPVEVGEIDNAGLLEARDQLWAEAVHYYRDGRAWWPGREDETLLEEQQDERYRVDVWEARIEKFLAARYDDYLKKPELIRGEEFSVTIEDILSGSLNIEVKEQDDKHAMRVGRIMTRLRWVRRRTRTANPETGDKDGKGNRRRVYAYFPPTPTLDDAGDAIEPGTGGDEGGQDAV